ncbi:ubiquitin-specific protease ubp2 [Elasticomyces elasticus]|nr:ubiquitin-specific protease ubp2 [Elasticomyces elasticus]KAK3657226.1 ubiquitin-specific protease ubp2 [Elasticomyces elasticus]KAK4922227.1 ubiquitin-specific protease ubp2 [Elasticomyces elasticus]KAK5760834.1 ubiquitin-specific protease ubp2 [Elasticomyces elasticus]
MSGPGKLAPKLCDDFLNFDPNKTLPTARLLVDHSPPVGEGQYLSYKIGSCRHEYTTKHTQSILPPLDSRPDATTTYKLSVVCKKCRLHAVVVTDYARSTDPCPNSGNPQHHFRNLPDEGGSSATQIAYAWQCSASQCQAQLQITYRTPRLTDGDRDLLTNTERLKRRFDAVVEHNPSRDGLRQATPMEALSRLRKYIHDSLNPTHNRRAFPADNKRFMETFGVHGKECLPLLQRLGFKYDEADTGFEWSLPNPEVINNRLTVDVNDERELLEDVEFELAALMFRIAIDTGAMNPSASEGWSDAKHDLERTLAAQGYPRYAPLRRVAPPNDLLPYFASLGALPDFADTLIEFAFDRQLDCDPERQSYYFECLQEIAKNRASEQLQTRVAMLHSQDMVSRRDVSAAFRHLDIPLRLPHEKPITDEYILDCFQARQANSSAAVAEGNRDALYKIGISRHSQPLISASKQSVETYEEALAWLGQSANKDMPDDMLLAIAATKQESASDKEIARKAISTIARERKSEPLNNWLLTGSSSGFEMTVEEAMQHITGTATTNLSAIDATILGIQIDSARSDRPGEHTEKAIRTIQKAMAHSPATWPVGLVSHGNTCYLNSLLQYYFGMKAYRDIILNYDQYKLDLHDATVKEHRVGGTQISTTEIKSGQRFARDLRELFQRMIKTRDSSVMPSKDLVCRAFLAPERYSELASDAIDDDVMPNGAEEHADTKISDVTAPIAETPDPDSASKEERRASVASSATLQADDDAPMLDHGDRPPTPPASPTLKALPGKESSHSAPPLPPRRRATLQEMEKAEDKALKEAEEEAKKQQDVTEVHDSATQRLRAGMKALGVDDKTEEQVDALRVLYTVAVTDAVLRTDGTREKPSVSMHPGIQLNVPMEDTDIYSALDEVFDLQPSEREQGQEAFKSIRTLPPIVQVCIPRIAYENGQTSKFTKTVKLEDELYLDRYLENSDIFASREACWTLRRRLRNMRRERRVLRDADVAPDLDVPGVMSEAAAHLESLSGIDAEVVDIGLGSGLEIGPDLASDMKSAAERHSQRVVVLTKEIDSLHSELKSKCETAYRNLKTSKYRLAAVFFHRGGHGGGHYWLDIHDFTNNIWRRYNDETVQELPDNRIHEILEAKTYDHGTPTYVVYVEDSQKEELVQPVCRDPEPAPEPVQWENESARPAPFNTVDPKMITEGGRASWDSPRSVAETAW